MTATAILLIVASAFLHAGWNLISRRARSSAAFFLVSTLAGAALLSPGLIFYRFLLPDGLPPGFWALLLGTAFFMTLYFGALAGAYRRGDISVAYPLARSVPAIAVLAITVLLGRGHQISLQCVLGIVLVVVGCLAVPLRRFDQLHLQTYFNTTCGYALLAAIATAGYSLVDDEALRLLRADDMSVREVVGVTVVYGCLQAAGAAFGLAILVIPRRRGREELRLVIRHRANQALLAGVVMYVTYLMVLVSFAHAENVSYVLGFRQLSIPLGAALGIFILKEAADRPKLVGVAMTFVGLVLVATG